MKRALRPAVLVLFALLLAAGAYLLGRSTSPQSAASARPPAAALEPAAKQVWTCSMHPQVRLDQPGDCPICEMPLIPAASATAAAPGEAPTLQLSEHALAMASVETVAVERRPLARELRAVGRIEFNESSLATITPRVDGYAERLFVNFTGVEIRSGDHLAEVYSPELLVAQQELLIALQSGDAGGALTDVARTRLRLLGLTDDQVTNLVERKQTTDRVTLYSPISGTVIEKSIVEQAAFKAGDALYRIANLDSVWVYLEVYEYDLPWIRYGQKVRVTGEALPGRTFEGMVTFVQPFVDEQSRTIRIPVHIDNQDHALKPGMFVSAAIDASLTPDGQAAPTGVEGKFTCPMHPQVLTEVEGACPICQMPLERIPGLSTSGGPDPATHGRKAAEQVEPPSSPSPSTRYICPMECEGQKTYAQPGRCPVCKMKLKEVASAAATTASAGVGPLAVPVSAILDSGTRKIVFVEKSRGLFEPRELEVGPRAGAYYPVLRGLSAGERVVTRGNFLIDSQFQVTGHPSLFYPGGLHATTGHEHGDTAPLDPAAQPGTEPTPPSTQAPAGGHTH
ncbi:MAG: efflux RND transporter periplasmic adaptor subunit [Leptolyngbya sp. PLA3]|nr:MAG: efflux RND transporter periplasmic adaptor subunit [Cyanobacteria bacterium CYA]MCE7968152.1 efflux RND transporter periplasmic adaptor subunit [Leptolyngbya sp. PL-A3]